MLKKVKSTFLYCRQNYLPNQNKRTKTNNSLWLCAQWNWLENIRFFSIYRYDGEKKLSSLHTTLIQKNSSGMTIKQNQQMKNHTRFSGQAYLGLTKYNISVRGRTLENVWPVDDKKNIFRFSDGDSCYPSHWFKTCQRQAKLYKQLQLKTRINVYKPMHQTL